MARIDHDTAIGGPLQRFPATRGSAVQAARSADPAARARAFETLVASYWKPVYKYLRLRWRASNEEAKDLTQAFFADALEQDLFARYQAGRASFRTYLRLCLDGFASNARKSQRRMKRGGGRQFVSLDFDTAEQEFLRHTPADQPGSEQYFDQEWVRSLFGLAVDGLRELCRARGKNIHFRLFDRYDLQRDDAAPRPTYEQLAREFHTTATQVTNHLAWARREFRELVLARLREMTVDDAEFRAEASRLLGVAEV